MHHQRAGHLLNLQSFVVASAVQEDKLMEEDHRKVLASAEGGSMD